MTTNLTDEPSGEPWRVFCAVELPNSLRESLGGHIARLRKAVSPDQASWSRAENIHLTLKFIGEIPQNRVRKLSEAAALATENFSPFKIVAERTGVFPAHGVPRVGWIGITDLSGKLARLHSRLEHECAKVGFPKEQRPFHPHLTLARFRKTQGAGGLALAHMELGFEPVEINVPKLLVIRSELGAEGSKYTVISTHPLERQQHNISRFGRS